jgi:phosphohistidine phosphatase SixA
MFAIIRHAPYNIGSGSLSADGERVTKSLAHQLKMHPVAWQGIRTSPTSRTQETAAILGTELSLAVETDARLGTDGNMTDLLPPTEPQELIFVSHLPVITQMLRAWSKLFHQDEPALVELGSGYLIDPSTQTIAPIHPR